MSNKEHQNLKLLLQFFLILTIIFGIAGSVFGSSDCNFQNNNYIVGKTNFWGHSTNNLYCGTDNKWYFGNSNQKTICDNKCLQDNGFGNIPTGENLNEQQVLETVAKDKSEITIKTPIPWYKGKDPEVGTVKNNQGNTVLNYDNSKVKIDETFSSNGAIKTKTVTDTASGLSKVYDNNNKLVSTFQPSVSGNQITTTYNKDGTITENVKTRIGGRPNGGYQIQYTPSGQFKVYYGSQGIVDKSGNKYTVKINSKTYTTTDGGKTFLMNGLKVTGTDVDQAKSLLDTATSIKQSTSVNEIIKSNEPVKVVASTGPTTNTPPKSDAKTSPVSSDSTAKQIPSDVKKSSSKTSSAKTSTTPKTPEVVKYDSWGAPINQNGQVSVKTLNEKLDSSEIDKDLRHYKQYYKKNPNGKIDISKISDSNKLFAFQLYSKQTPTAAKKYIDDPLSVSTSDRQIFKKYGITPSSEGYDNLLSDIKNNEKALKNLKDDPKGIKKKELEAKNSEAKKLLEGMSFANILKLSKKNRDDVMNHFGTDCNGLIGEIGCFLSKKITIEQKADQQMNIIAGNLNSQCEKQSCDINTYNTKLKKEVNTYVKELGFKCQDITSCKEALANNQITCDKSDSTCEANIAVLKTMVNKENSLERVQTSTTFDILSGIVNPDRNAIKAAKLFGFEADYSNVPAFLKESVPSYICLSKINGYLDKTRQTTVDGVSGTTVYGCSGKYSQVYDIKDRKFETTGNPNCIEVLADLRAQRTRITPDNKTTITYSYYLRAPPNTDIKFLVAVSYIQAGLIQKKQIFNVKTLKGGKVSTGYDHILLPLDGDMSKIDENSFVIYLLAVYNNGGIYQKISSPIYLVTLGNSYGSLYTPPSSASNSGTPVAVPQASNKLSTDNLLAMI